MNQILPFRRPEHVLHCLLDPHGANEPHLPPPKSKSHLRGAHLHALQQGLSSGRPLWCAAPCCRIKMVTIKSHQNPTALEDSHEPQNVTHCCASPVKLVVRLRLDDALRQGHAILWRAPQGAGHTMPFAAGEGGGEDVPSKVGSACVLCCIKCGAPCLTETYSAT